MIVRPAPVEALRRGVNGQLELNPDRALVQAWVQGTTKQSRVTVAALGQGRDSINVQADDVLSGDALFSAFTSDHLGPYRVSMTRQGSEPQAFMNVPIRIEFLTGYADDPFYFPCPIYTEARSGLEVVFQNLTTEISNKIRFRAHGQRYFNTSREALDALRVNMFDPRQRPFWLGLDDTTASLSASVTDQHVNMTVPSDGDFESEGIWIRATGPFSMKISQNLSGRPLMNGGGQNQVLVYDEAFGGGTYFYRWKSGTAYFKRLTVLDIALTNEMASTNTVEIVQVGRLLDYPQGSFSPSAFVGPVEMTAPYPVATPGPAVSAVSGRQIPSAFAGLNWMGAGT